MHGVCASRHAVPFPGRDRLSGRCGGGRFDVLGLAAQKQGVLLVCQT